MDLSSTSRLSVEDQLQKIEDLFIEARQKTVQEQDNHLDRAQGAGKEHATPTLALEGAEREGITQAQDKEPRSIEDSLRADLHRDFEKAMLLKFQQQQMTSSSEEGGNIGGILVRNIYLPSPASITER